MKFKLGALIIVLSTAGLIGLLNLVMSKSTNDINVYAKEPAKIADQLEPGEPKNAQKPVLAERKDIKVKHDEPNDKPKAAQADSELSEDDVKKIMAVARLSDAELAKEIEGLKDQIEDDDLFELLEEGELSADKEQEAKEVLERFALLGLEETRRKFMDKEPELKDALYAHKDSLKEIRELLSDD